MNRSELQELHYITDISNVPSILINGLLSHRKAQRLGPASVAMPEIQDIREKKTVPGGQPLHTYVNLYLCARNPMLFKRKDRHLDLCVLRVDPDVLNLPQVVITDGNAASNYTRFFPSPAGLSKVDKSLVFATYWTDSDQFEAWRKKAAKCAEVLAPDQVPPRFILGAYVSCEEAQLKLKELAPTLTVVVNAPLFFR